MPNADSLELFFHIAETNTKYMRDHARTCSYNEVCMRQWIQVTPIMLTYVAEFVEFFQSNHMPF